jgi:hypothetical protein
MQGNKDLVLLQNPVEVERTSGHSVHALPRVHSKATRQLSHAMRVPSLLSRSFPGQGAAPEARWPPHQKEIKPYTNQQTETGIMTRSKFRQAPTLSKDPPD